MSVVIREVPFSDKEECVNRLIANTVACRNIGLLYGKMGCVVAFYVMSRKGNDSQRFVYEKFASKVLDDVTSSISKNTSIDFAHGLCGIGWGIEFLISEGFIDGNSLDLLEEIDKAIMQINPHRFPYTLHYGLKGVLHYILAHINNCMSQDGIRPFDQDFLHTVYKSSLMAKNHSEDIELSMLADSYINFMNTGYIDYSFNPMDFIKKEVVDKNLSTLSVALEDGLSGYLLINA